ncbi:MAG: tRNA pseudouridine(55) synthase TruB [Nitrospinae bacterium]|nr:tRNA pseudouridine(55) synthase TruB [Nitrospinota bacterium]
MINGILNINKEKGLTSHDVVLRVRQITGEKKIGHTGTLDPNATGVLVLCLGRATKLAQNFMKFKKVYAAKARLGIVTDTQDSEGKIIKQAESIDVEKSQICDILKKFTGEIEQTPPMYSAVKHKGKRLYSLARKGITVERKAKTVNIYRLDFKGFDGEYFDFEAETSSGVYIRTLADDIGRELGCGAHLAELARVEVGDYKLKDAVTLAQLQEIVNQGKLRETLIQAV